jgi:UDP-N-acetylmuramoyl-L-alanyl-D-glutamate--2,6-diaminopimelate ligase
MKLSDVLKGTDIETDSKMEIKGITTSSKEVSDNFIFFAIKGEKTDGDLYIDEAIKNGAKVIISQNKIENRNVISFKTSDILKTLSVASKNFYNNPSSKMKIIGITGTKGKTTVTTLIQKVLNTTINTGLIGTINYTTHNQVISPAQNTTPLPHKLHEILSIMLENKEKCVVLEVSSHSLKLKRVDDIEFDCAGFTNLTSDHMDFHKTKQDYINSKAKLFEILESSPKKEKIAVLNLDDEFSDVVSPKIKTARIISYSLKKSSDIRATDIKLEMNTSVFKLDVFGKIVEIRTKLIGIHNVYNIMCAFACAYDIVKDVQKIVGAIEEIENIPGRLEKIESKTGFCVFIDYAHTEDSLRQVLITLNQIPHRKIITVFGCGGDRDKTKRPLMGHVSEKLSDFVIITSDNPRSEDPLKIISDIENGMTQKNKYIIEPDREKAIKKAIEIASKGDIIIIAGKGHEDYQIIGDKKIHFSDRECVMKYLKDI